MLKPIAIAFVTVCLVVGVFGFASTIIDYVKALDGYLKETQNVQCEMHVCPLGR